MNFKYKKNLITYSTDAPHLKNEKRDLPINSVGFLSMNCPQILMNIAVVSAEGHSPWLKQRMALLLEDIQMVYAP